VPFKVVGDLAVKRRLIALAQRVPNEALRALYEEALIEEKESRQRTPVDTGALRASHVTTPQMNGRDISVKIEVGGPATPYAFVVHEKLGVFHPVGQAKFLESTIRESRPFIPARVARRMQMNRAFRI